MVERIRTLLESRQLTPTQFADLIGVARPIVSHILSGRNKPSLEVVQRILAAIPDLAMPWLLNGSGPMLAGASPSAAGTVPVAVTAAPLVASVQAIAPGPERSALPQSAEIQGDLPVAQESVAPNTRADVPAGRHSASVAEPAGRHSKPARIKPAATLKRFVAQTVVVDKSDGSDKMESRLPDTQAATPGLTATGPSAAVTASDSFKASVPAAGLPVASAPVSANGGAPTANAAPTEEITQPLFAGTEKPIRRIVIFYRDGSFADYQPE